MAKQINWLSEKEAAALFNYRYPRTLRAKVKQGIIPASYRTIEGRNFQYAEQDLQKYLETRTYYR